MAARLLLLLCATSLIIIGWTVAAAQTPPPAPEPVDDPEILLQLPEVGDEIEAYLHLPTIEPPSRIRTLATSNQGFCVLYYGGVSRCFDLNGQRQNSPTVPLLSLSAGDAHYCGLDQRSHVVCWGQSPGATAAPEDEAMLAVAAGANHSCAIDSSGKPRCWGDADRQPSSTLRGPFAFIEAAGDRSCAFGARETSRCWEDSTSSTKPFDQPVGKLAMSSDVTCAIDHHNRPVCLFHDAAPRRPRMPTTRASDIAAGRDFACTLDPQGVIECVGSGAPQFDDQVQSAQMIDAGEELLCAATATSAIRCWNDAGPITWPTD